MDLTFAIIGPGSVGSVLLRSLERAGYRISAVFGRDDDLSSLPDSTTAVAICVPDVAVSDVAEELPRVVSSWTDRLVFHVSGALTSEVLAPLARVGAQTLSFHPLSSFPPGDSRRELRDITIAIQGPEPGLSRMMDVAWQLGATPIALSIEQKVAYHVAATMASNFLVTLADCVERVLASADLDPRLTDDLVDTTLLNIRDLTPVSALTGPIARGDVETVRLHLETLKQVAPDQEPLYKSLARATTELAYTSERIGNEQRDSILALLQHLEDEQQ